VRAGTGQVILERDALTALCLPFLNFMSARNWCFTLNNPTVEDITSLICLNNLNVVFLLMCLEKGTEQETLHYQGYLELDRHRRQAFVKNLIPRAHLEPRKGTASQATRYCLKDVPTEKQVELISWEQGTFISDLQEPTDLPSIIMINTEKKTLNEILSKEQSKTSKKDERLVAMKKAIDGGSTDLQLADLDFPIWVQNYRGLLHYRQLRSAPRNHAVEVIVIVGPTGTGKSKFCMDNYADAYWKQRSNWWDGYMDHETVVIDEFYGWLPFDTLLRVCDRYPLLVESKGGQINFSAKRIVMTSNRIPERWYQNVYFTAFVRRVSSWRIMPTWGNTIETTDYAEAQKHMTDHCPEL